MESCFHSEHFFQSLFEKINDTVLLYDLKTSQLVKTNKRVFDLFGYTEDNNLQANITNCLTTEEPYTADRFREYAEKATHNEPQLIEWKVKNKEGRYFWIEVSMKRAFLAGQDFLIVVMSDITPLKQANEANKNLLNSEARFRELVESLPQVVFQIDCQANLTFCNNAAFDFFGASQEDFKRGINVVDYVIPEDRKRCLSRVAKVMQGEITKSGTEYTMFKKDGTRVPVMLHASPIIKNGHVVGSRGFLIDISRLKKNEQKLRFLSCHDALTGLYSRYFFEQRLSELNGNCRMAAIIICDIDGLKIINDSLGHAEGDERLAATAEIITRVFHEQHVTARIGSDEFAILLIGVDLTMAQKRITQVTEAVNEYNKHLTDVQIPLSLSMGIAHSSEIPIKLWDLFKEADNNMYRQKLYRNQSKRSSIVQTLLKALEARDIITEGHADRLKDFVSILGMNLNLPDNKVTDLCLLAHFHDIGKVGIPDRILFKKGRFTSEEYAEMQRHSEIGFKIAKSSPDLVSIADWILKHHEWWNGQGYPLGLKGEEIPLECRILAIADAYDAMTNDRPYRRAMPLEEAIKELKRGSGSQFDPELVERFLCLIPKLAQKKIG